MTGPAAESLRTIFRTDYPSRDKFLSRLFGIFNEEIIRIWCRDSRSPYVDLGRPSVLAPNSDRTSVLDFTLEHTKSGSRFVAEMKCEMEYENYKYLVLTDPSQLEHHKKKAFADLLVATRTPNTVTVTVADGYHRRPVEAVGGILIWGSVSAEGRTAVIDKYGFADVISLEESMADLNRWNSLEFKEYVTLRES